MKSNVYTRTGDNGTTSLVGGTRIAKNNIRLEAYGTVDELNSWLGLLDSSTAIPPEQHQVLTNAMHRLFDIGSALATEAESTWQPAPMPDSVVEHLEATIDSLDANLPRHNRYAMANIARAVARRAERNIISLADTAPVQTNILRYINRLSDYLFVLSRAINIYNNRHEIFWEKSC